MSHKQIHIGMTEALREALKTRANAEGVSATELVNQLVIEYLCKKSSGISSSHINYYQTKLAEAPINQVSTAMTLPEKSISLESKTAPIVEADRLENRFTLLESYVLALQNQLLKAMSGFEQRLSLLEAQPADKLLQSNTFSTQQCSNQQTEAFQPRVDAPIPERLNSNHQEKCLVVPPSKAPQADLVALNAPPRQWLSLAEAYLIAQQSGYRLSMYAFRMIVTCSGKTTQEYGRYGLGSDRSRRGTAGVLAKWLYRLE